MSPTSLAESDEDELAVVLRQTRDRFITSFAGRCDDMQAGLLALTGGPQPPESTRQIAHRIAGLAGTVGFPAVSRVASEIEELLIGCDGGHASLDQLPTRLDALRDAFAIEMAEPLPAVAVLPSASANGQRILVVDDDPDQRQLTVRTLERGGYEVMALPLADTVIETVEHLAPAAVLLDVMMPGIDGHLACRLLKGEASVRDVPVIFVSSHAALEERMAGLALGAVDYVAKPIDANELLFRVGRAIAGRQTAVPDLPAPVDVLEYEEFARRAEGLLSEGVCTLALLRVDSGRRDHLAAALVAESRRRDLIGQFDRLHLVLLLPGLSPATVAGRIGLLIEGLAGRGADVRAGLASSTGTMTIDALISEAEAALAEARYRGVPVSRKGERTAAPGPAAPSHLVLLADDDPEVMRIVDAQMRTLRFDTTLAFDGEAAMAALSAQTVNLLVLDLMLPKITGFEILHQLKTLGDSRPRLIVLSARGREEDITRAFQLGADDYITKPFRPQELAARAVRLLR